MGNQWKRRGGNIEYIHILKILKNKRKTACEEVCEVACGGGRWESLWENLCEGGRPGKPVRGPFEGL